MAFRSGIPSFEFYERVVMRALFAATVWRATPNELRFNEIPSPNGITRLIDLHFLLQPDLFAAARIALGVALVLYLFRIWQALPIALFVNLAANGIVNAQGAVQHAFQIVSLVLLAQTAAYFYGAWVDRKNESPELTENRAIWWSQQTIVAVYLLAGIAKIIRTGGLWIFQARWIGVSIAKAAYQASYDSFPSTDFDQRLSVAQFAAAHGWLVALIATAGLVLELGSPLLLINRAWAAFVGGALLCFHLGLEYAMGLSFIYNQWLLIIFVINPPYWIILLGRKIFAVRRPAATSP
jgi:hypothetical protein